MRYNKGQDKSIKRQMERIILLMGSLFILLCLVINISMQKILLSNAQEHTDITAEKLKNQLDFLYEKKVTIPEYNQRCTELVMELGIEYNVHFDDDFLNIMTGEEPVDKMWNELCEDYEKDGLSDMITKVNEALSQER